MTTEKQRRAYTETERTHGDHLVLDAEHHNARKDDYGDPEGI
jgi:hypothetical protein